MQALAAGELGITCSVALLEPISPHISPHLPTSPHISPHLPVSPYISLHLPRCSVALLDGPTRLSVLRSALGDLRVFAATADSPGGGPPGGGPPGGAEAAAPTAAAAAAAVYLEGTAGGREGGAADTLVGRVVPADGVQGAPAGALAVADEEAYLYAEEFWVDGDEVDGVYSPRSSEVEPGL